MSRLWSSRGAQQGVAHCPLAGPWLESNFFVTLPCRPGESSRLATDRTRAGYAPDDQGVQRAAVSGVTPETARAARGLAVTRCDAMARRAEGLWGMVGHSQPTSTGPPGWWEAHPVPPLGGEE